MKKLKCPECGAMIIEDLNCCPECGCPMEYIRNHQPQMTIAYSASSDISDLMFGANRNDASAQYWLGYIYYNGLNGQDEDENEAKKWIKIAADSGYAQAISNYEEWFGNTQLLADDYPLKELFSQFDSIVVFDTETSGLDAKTEEIIELAATKIRPCGEQVEVSEEMDCLIKLSPGRKVSRTITDLTSITNEMLIQEGVCKKEACKKFEHLLNGENILLVAYNAQFDMGFLYYFLKKFGQYEILKKVRMLDVLTVYKDRRSYPHKLCNAIDAYDLGDKVENSHKAIDDARATVQVLIAMDEECQDLDRYINLFGYNPKYSVNGERIASIKYLPQPYNSHKKLYE